MILTDAKFLQNIIVDFYLQGEVYFSSLYIRVKLREFALCS